MNAKYYSELIDFDGMSFKAVVEKQINMLKVIRDHLTSEEALVLVILILRATITFKDQGMGHGHYKFRQLTSWDVERLLWALNGVEGIKKCKIRVEGPIDGVI